MLEVTCPRCGEQYFADESQAGRKLRCRRCATIIEIAKATATAPHADLLARATPARPAASAGATGTPPAVAGRNQRTWHAWVGFAVAVLVIVAVGIISRSEPAGRSGSAGGRAAARSDRWVTVSYADLVDRQALVRTNGTLGDALGNPDLRGAVQPFLDRYSYLLQDAVQMLVGPDELPHRDVVDQFPPGSPQPAWAAIFRSGRIHIVFDGVTHARAFLPGDSPEEAYRQNYSVIRHCLNGLVPQGTAPLNVDVFAYQNQYGSCTFRLDTRPYRVSGRSFPSDSKAVNLAALEGFFSQQPELAGAQLSKTDGLVLIGKKGKLPSLAGSAAGLADLAVAYRAVFHAGDNAAYISLDPHRDATKATVNFGGLLEDTRVGSVVLDADERFKTITTGLDPESHRDLRPWIRRSVPSFLTVAERDLCDSAFSGRGKWVGTRFWFYPDNIEVDTDLAGTTAVVTRPRFTADAERSRDDFASPEEFERRKAATLSPSIRTNIDHLNAHYGEYASAFPEIDGLSTVARFIGIAAWLRNADTAGLDLDALLSAELPACSTPRDRTRLVAVSTVRKPSAAAPSPQYVMANASVIYLTPSLDREVSEVFHTPRNLAEFLSIAHGDEGRQDAYEEEAAQLWQGQRHVPARQLIGNKDELRAFADYIADHRRDGSEAAMDRLDAAIRAQDAELNQLDAQISEARRELDLTWGDAHNTVVARHNRLVDRYNSLRARRSANVRAYNANAGETRWIVEIGGGIDLTPEHFRIRAREASPALDALSKVVRAAEMDGKAMFAGEEWIRSGRFTAGRLPAPRQLRRIPWRVEPQPGEDAARALAEAEGGYRSWRWVEAKPGSWHTLTKMPPDQFLETVYDHAKGVLRAATFRGGQAVASRQARLVGPDSIVFTRLDGKGLLAPTESPSWWSAVAE